MFYQSASQQETDGTLKLGQFEESLIKGLFVKLWAGYKEIAKAVAAPHG